MRVRIITALFDIKRDSLGDGRKIDEYLIWFKETLKIKCNMTIYTEERFKSFVEENRSSEYETDIIIQKLEEVPFYRWRDKIQEVLNSDYFKSKMKDLSRIECYLPEYNIIQYSKFGWLKEAVEKNEDDYFFWMDAGCSRFFGNFNSEKKWPDEKRLLKNKIIIQGNSNYLNNFNNMLPDEYIWDNNSMLVGTLFGGDGGSIKILYNEINNLFDEYFNQCCVNNEQFLLAILAKKNINLFDIRSLINGHHLPLFNLLS
jgi:hypothetical protein